MTERRSKRESTAVEESVAAADEPVATEAATIEPTAPVAEAPEAASPSTDAGAPEAEVESPAAAAASEVDAESESTESAVAPEAAAEADAAAQPEVAAEAEVAAEPEADAAAEPEGDAAAPPEAEPSEPIAAAVAEPVAEPAADERRPKGREPKAAPEAPPRPAGPRGLQLRYRSDVIPALIRQFEYANPNQVPRLDKIVINVGLGEALTNAKAMDAASGDLTMITGQKPIVLKARRSIAQFRVRTGNPIGLKVTLRGQRMWDFLERLTLLALPRIRDFRGTPSRSFDGRGNYTLGLREQIAFPEIDYDKVDRLRGLEVSIVTTAKSDEESKRLLELLGMPFAG
jgi:large subunit ribosomal protein L5